MIAPNDKYDPHNPFTLTGTEQDYMPHGKHDAKVTHIGVAENGASVAITYAHAYGQWVQVIRVGQDASISNSDIATDNMGVAVTALNAHNRTLATLRILLWACLGLGLFAACNHAFGWGLM